MAFLITLAFAAATLAPLAWQWIKIRKWARRVRSIRKTAELEQERMIEAANRHDWKAAIVHQSRFWELSELWEEELRRP